MSRPAGVRSAGPWRPARERTPEVAATRDIAMRIALRFADVEPTPHALAMAFPMQRETTHRWRAALAAAKRGDETLATYGGCKVALLAMRIALRYRHSDPESAAALQREFGLEWHSKAWRYGLALRAAKGQA